jgi:lipoate-protein ligase A
MILWVDGGHDPIENMRRDAALLTAAEHGAEPVLRLFRFTPHGITLGAHQRVERELDLERCAADGVPWAVRPTGGRAIFHAQEWTYSFAAAIADSEWGGGRAETYARLGAMIVDSLRRLGIPAALGHRETRGGPAAPRVPGGPATPCFATAVRDEIVLDGRKLVGSAQRRTRHAWLQQGSLLLGEGHLRLADYLALPESERQAVRDRLALATRHAGRWLDGCADLDRWAEALSPGLPSNVRRLDGPAGAFLLTLGNRDSYTAPVR